jgi:hypothetical protein
MTRIRRRVCVLSAWAGCLIAALAAVSAGCRSHSGEITPTAPSAVSSNTPLTPVSSTLLAAAKASGDTPVTTTIADSLNAFPLRVESDHLGPYTNTSPTQSLIQGIGDWEMTTYTVKNTVVPGNRAVFFDLTEPVAAGNPAPPIQTATVQAHLIAKCHVVGINVLNIAQGTTVSCPGDFRFDLSNGTAYRLSYAPNNFPEVNYMDITCLAADSTGCRQWTIATDGKTLTGSDPNPKGVQKLLQINPSTDAILADMGDYYISFSISLAR